MQMMIFLLPEWMLTAEALHTGYKKTTAAKQLQTESQATAPKTKKLFVNNNVLCKNSFQT